MNIEELKLRAKEYVELEANTKVKKVRYIDKFKFLNRTDIVLSVSTNKGDFWVVGGDSPINLYNKSKFNSADEAFSFHLGIISRLAERQIKEELRFNKKTQIKKPEDIGYDAFICHASEDKEDFVRPLAKELLKLKVKVWYDEFSLRIGDSLRRSIDKGLANSRYGIVVLSKNFFAKEWPQKELDGLTQREIDGDPVILPVWYKITKEEILKYSPTLADRVAADSRKDNIIQIAKKLKEVIINRRVINQDALEPDLDSIITNQNKSKREKISLEDNKLVHNVNLKLYSFLFKRFGFLKTGIGFGIVGISSILYLYQAFYLKWFQQTYFNVIFILLLIYSIYYFQFFLNKSCSECNSKFSLFKVGTYKTGECRIEGIPYDINEIEYKCDNCNKIFVEEEKVRHQSY